MAKSKEETVSSDFTERVMAEVIKEYGEGTAKHGKDILKDKEVIVPFSPNLDVALGGGIPTGTWVSISGPPKVGKTTSLLSFAVACQKLGMTIYYFNIERRLKKKNLEGIKGLDWQNKKKFVVIESSGDIVLSGQDFLDIAVTVLKTHPGCVVILDSVSSLVDSAILDGGIGTQTRGSGSKLISQFIDIVKDVVPINKSIVLGVTHLIADTSGRTAGKVEKAANRWLYQADVRMKATYAERWSVGGTKQPDGSTSGGTQIGQVVKWAVQESALGPPGTTADGRLRYGVGIDHAYELMENAKACSLITTAGAWNTLSFMERHLDLLGVEKWDEDAMKKAKAQGAEKTYELLAANPAWMKALQEEVMSFLGLKSE